MWRSRSLKTNALRRRGNGRQLALTAYFTSGPRSAPARTTRLPPCDRRSSAKNGHGPLHLYRFLIPLAAALGYSLLPRRQLCAPHTQTVRGRTCTQRQVLRIAPPVSERMRGVRVPVDDIGANAPAIFHSPSLCDPNHYWEDVVISPQFGSMQREQKEAGGIEEKR